MLRRFAVVPASTVAAVAAAVTAIVTDSWLMNGASGSARVVSMMATSDESGSLSTNSLSKRFADGDEEEDMMSDDG